MQRTIRPDVYQSTRTRLLKKRWEKKNQQAGIVWEKWDTEYIKSCYYANHLYWAVLKLGGNAVQSNMIHLADSCRLYIWCWSYFDPLKQVVGSGKKANRLPLESSTAKCCFEYLPSTLLNILVLPCVRRISMAFSFKTIFNCWLSPATAPPPKPSK